MPVQVQLAELMGTFPRLPYLHAIQVLNRSWSRVRDMRLWSWQFVADAQIYAPVNITAGAATTTAYSTSITVNGAAAAAINAANVAGAPPISSATLGVGRQIKIGSGSGVQAAVGPNYNITAWDGVSTLTIDRPFGEGTQTNVPYQIYKCYYAAPNLPFSSVNAPDANLIRFMSVTNKNSGYTIRGPKLWFTQDRLNAIDPNRGATGDAYIIASYGRNPLGQPVFEFYPAPVNATVYYCTYWTKWPDLSVTQDFPQVPYGLISLVMAGARKNAAEWALSNVSTHKELENTNWVASQMMYDADFKEHLKTCLRQDDEIMPQVPWNQMRGRFDFPLGGQFLQSHDLSSILP